MNRQRQGSLVFRSFSDALRRAIREHCDVTGDTEGDVAEEAGLSQSYMSNMSHGVVPLAIDTAVRFERVLQSTVLAEVHARLVGGMFVPLPTGAGIEHGSLRDLMAQFSKHADAVIAATDPDGDGGKAITQKEADVIEESGRLLQACIEQVVNEAQAAAAHGVEKRARTLAEAG